MHNDQFNDSRRKMIRNSILAGTSAFFIPGMQTSARPQSHYAAYTVGEVVNLILKEIPGAPFAQTVDTLKSGTREQQVTGIVTTMFATVPIIHEAARRKANFIIAHEPTFFNHTDDKTWSGPNVIAEEKAALLAKHNIAVWRFHDYWHSHRPDGVRFGVVKKMGWEKYDPESRGAINIPEVSLGDLAAQFKKNLAIQHLRVIGDLRQSCSTIALIPGAAGGQTQMRMAEQLQPDVLIVGEVHEWETAEYVRDARALGKKIALIVLGHPVSEEPGMEWLVTWLQPKLQGIAISHIPTPDPFTWL